MERLHCKCCGGVIAPNVSVPLLGLILKQNGHIAVAEAVEYLDARPGEWVSKYSVAEHVYRKATDGGPENVKNVLSARISQAKPLLHKMNYDIIGRTGNVGGLMLVYDYERARLFYGNVVSGNDGVGRWSRKGRMSRSEHDEAMAAKERRLKQEIERGRREAHG